MEFQRLCRAIRDITHKDLCGEFSDATKTNDVIILAGTIGTIMEYKGYPPDGLKTIHVWYYGAISWYIPAELLEPVFEEIKGE